MYKKLLISASIALASNSAFADTTLYAPEGIDLKTVTPKLSEEKGGATQSLKRDLKLKSLWNSARGADSGSGVDASAPKSAVGRDWNGAVTTDHVLAILIDFPDYPVNAVTPDLTRNYYEDYSREHYQDMLFSDTGYAGPSGQNLISMKQYYQDQSGGSYQVEGQVAGWYHAKFNAAYYGAPSPDGRRRDSNVSALIMEAINQLALDPNFDWAFYDQEDRYDYNGNGNFREPDGLIDHVMVFHSSIDEAARGGALGPNAIWSHRSRVSGTPQPIGNTGLAILDYTIQPVDGAAGVSAHEYGHDLGLPDEYDVDYSEDGLGTVDAAPGSLVGYWSIMSSGSYGGEIAGTAPTGMSPFAKEYLQTSLGGNWFVGSTVHANDLTATGKTYKLDTASVRGDNNDYLRIDLEDKQVQKLVPNDGKGFASAEITRTDGDVEFSSLDFFVDLTNEANAQLKFAASYDSHTGASLAFVSVRPIVNGQPTAGVTLAGNITSTSHWFSQWFGPGFTGNSGGKQDAVFDLSPFAGQQVLVDLVYVSFNTGHPGVMFDDITVEGSAGTILNYDVDSSENPGLFITGFEASDGIWEYPQYYLVEWRQHEGVDESLANLRYGMSYEPGMLVWYVDTSYRPEKTGDRNSTAQGDNLVGVHPGEGWLGLVDADRNPILYSNGEMAGSAVQIHDAAFSLNVHTPFNGVNERAGVTISDPFILNTPGFIDFADYSNWLRPATGRKLPSKGILIDILGQSSDKSVASIRISKMW